MATTVEGDQCSILNESSTRTGLTRTVLKTFSKSFKMFRLRVLYDIKQYTTGLQMD